MDEDRANPRRHESVDHEHPTDVGPMSPSGGGVPGTDIFGDETLVRDADGQPCAGLYPEPKPHPVDRTDPPVGGANADRTA